MDVSTIITKSRKQTSTSAWQKTDELMLADLNLVYKEIFSRLSTKSKKYTRQTYSTTTVIDQNEYNIPKPTVSDTWLKRLLNIQVKYTSDWDYIPCKIHDSSTPIDSDYDNYNKPYCIERDGSIFLYPAPTEALDDWLVVDWQYLPLDLTLTTVSANIKLESEYHDVLLHWLNMWNFGDKQLFDKQVLSKQLFEEWVSEIISEWASDVETAYEQSNSEIITVSDSFLP